MSAPVSRNPYPQTQSGETCQPGGPERSHKKRLLDRINAFNPNETSRPSVPIQPSPGGVWRQNQFKPGDLPEK